MARLMIGDPAPDFELENQEGEIVSLESYRGRKTVVLYFYPKDETPGCIKEACGFRDQYEDFIDAGAEVLGISADSVNSHKLFALSRRLPFQLLSDPKNKTRKAYGVANDMLGFIPGRETFVIDKYGKIQFRFASQTKIGQHIDDALRVVKKLNSESSERVTPKQVRREEPANRPASRPRNERESEQKNSANSPREADSREDRDSRRD